MPLEDEIRALRANHTQEQLMEKYKELAQEMRGLTPDSESYDIVLDLMDVVWYAMDMESQQLIDIWAQR